MAYLFLFLIGCILLLILLIIIWRIKTTKTWPKTKAKLVFGHKSSVISTADYRVIYYVKGVKYETEAAGITGGITPLSEPGGRVGNGAFYIFHGTSTPKEFNISYNPNNPFESTQVHILFGSLIGKLVLFFLFSSGIFALIYSTYFLYKFG